LVVVVVVVVLLLLLLPCTQVLLEKVVAVEVSTKPIHPIAYAIHVSKL